jgi:molybdopterin synthase sulfur carrier subunit
MPITVRYFASLGDKLGRESDEIPATPAITAGQVWQQVAGDLEMPANTLVAINQDYAEMDQPVKDGDEVAFFPPVTGG